MAPISTRALSGGGRTGARRLIAWAAAIVFGAVSVTASAGAEPRADVTVNQRGGLYHVAASFDVPQPAGVAMSVLADYDQIPRFMPDVRTSKVLERNGAHAVVEQQAVATFLMFSRRIHLVLEVHQTPGTLRFRDRCGQSFATYEGQWTVTEVGARTLVTYQLTARPDFEVPDFLLRRLLKRDSTRMIQRLAAEIAARHHPAAAPGP